MFHQDLLLDYHKYMKKNLIIITPYPKTGKYSHETSALASFNKNLVDILKTQYNIVILADNENKKDQAVKAWEKNDFFNYFKLLKVIAGYKSIQNILIQFEWGVFGNNILFIGFFPVFLLILKFLGKKTSVVLHGVSFDFKSIYGAGLKTKLLNAGSYVFYSLVCLLSGKIIVTENYFKKQLSKLLFAENKVIFIPHGVDTAFVKKQNKYEEKINFGYFGFLHPYKGPKNLLNLYESIDKTKFSLNFFGGASPSLEKNKDYRQYLDDFKQKAKELKVFVSGFVKEKDLSQYFNKVDLVIFPYPSFISSSGMLAMTFSLEKPFILSQPLAGYFDSPDFADALKQTDLKKEDFLFDFNQKSFEYRLNWAKNNLKKLADFSRIMKEKRAWSRISRQYSVILIRYFF